MYRNCWIVSCAEYNHEVKTNILRGVKQRNPLTLLLPNLCLEPQLEETAENTEGINVREEGNIPILAFTDDVVLFGKDKIEAQRQITMVLNGNSATSVKEPNFPNITKKGI
jgi:hypothetical protein